MYYQDHNRCTTSWDAPSQAQEHPREAHTSLPTHQHYDYYHLPHLSAVNPSTHFFLLYFCDSKGCHQAGNAV